MALKIPTICGLIERRILVNYRVDPIVLANTLPAPFRPKLVRGFGVAGICLIRLKHIRPRHLPAWVGISSENAAHRVAVEWDEPSGRRDGVFVSRRDTNSRLNVLAGGCVFPGIHHHARFRVNESESQFEIEMRSNSDDTAVALRASIENRLPAPSVFGSLEAASDFFQRGALGYSTTDDFRRFQGLELRCREWRMEPLDVERVQSSHFDNERVFPNGSIGFDSAFLMRGIEHEWHERADLCCGNQA